jgi:hypothetical protein
MTSQRQKTVTVSMTTSYTAPKNMEEAQKRVASLTDEILQLRTQLDGRHVSNPITGERLTTEEYFAWKERTRIILASKTTELRYLKAWVKRQERASAAMSGAPAKREPAFQLLWRCAELFRRLTEEGVEFTPDERKLLAEVNTFTALQASSLLDAARALMTGAPDNVFHFGSIIARATRDEYDLTVLRAAWSKVCQTSSNQGSFENGAVDYVRALAALGRVEEAVVVARMFDTSHSGTAFIWFHIARHSQDADHLALARSLGAALEPRLRAWFLLRIYRLTGDREDGRLATPPPEVYRVLGKKADAYRVSLLDACITWGHLDEAREIYDGIESAEARLSCMARISEFTEDPEDLGQLIGLIGSCESVRPSTIKRVVLALAQNDREELALHVLGMLPEWYLRCIGFSVLAQCSDGPKAEDMLDQAEQVVTSATMKGTTEESDALLNLVYALVVHGRIEAAIRILGVMREQENRCKAILLIDAVKSGREMPDFITENL